MCAVLGFVYMDILNQALYVSVLSVFDFQLKP